MHKMFAVFKREYLQAVRKKMFIIMTILLPVLIAAVFILPSRLMMKGLGKKQITVIDGTGQLGGAFEHAGEPSEEKANARPDRRDLPTSMTVAYVARPGEAHL